eukprot:9042132-Alexandrium_andersonii.AAC.1
MSASLVGSEMCIRDRPTAGRVKLREEGPARSGPTPHAGRHAGLRAKRSYDLQASANSPLRDRVGSRYAGLASPGDHAHLLH